MRLQRRIVYERHNADTDMSAKKATKTTKKKSAHAVHCSRFFIAQPGYLLKNLASLQKWHEWEVGDHRGQDRICLTSCKRKAELIRDALESFHANSKTHTLQSGCVQ
jgi:hypothetical protein